MCRDFLGEGTEHEIMALVLFVQAQVLLARGNMESSEEACTASLEMTKRMRGPETSHPTIARRLNLLGKIQFERKNLDEALKYTRDSLEMYRQIYSFDKAHRRIAEVEASLEQMVANV